ncbi:MAG: PorV/PorQ family protein [Chitinophagales bacterium]|nr:PorV/PorQ family protein [Chitinophagales bacterium]MDW8272611.1 PorV/PorQ family protein [Chitinophagales bacterium]
MTKTYLLILVATSMCYYTMSQTVRKYSNEFLNIGVGARGLAMGTAQAASCEDVYSAYYNPAGLARIQNTFQLGFMHTEYFAGIAKWDFGAFAVPIRDKKSVIGISFYRFGVDDIPNTLFLIGPDNSINYNNIRSFSVADYAFMFHYAQKLPVEGLTVGGSAKVIYRQVGTFAKAFGFGIDAGLQYRWKGLQAGLMLRDITTTFAAWDFTFTEEEKRVLLQSNNQLPASTTEITVPHIHLGLAYKVSIKNKFFILPEANFIFSTDGRRNVLLSAKPISMDINAGLELNLFNIGYIRGGFNNLQRIYAEDGKQSFSLSPCMGVGVHIKVISLDYALTNLTTLNSNNTGSTGLYSNVISLRLDINKRKP